MVAQPNPQVSSAKRTNTRDSTTESQTIVSGKPLWLEYLEALPERDNHRDSIGQDDRITVAIGVGPVRKFV